MSLTANLMELKAAAEAAVTENWPISSEMVAFRKIATPAAILALLALVEAAQADAARYKWMRDGKRKMYTCQGALLDSVVDREMTSKEADHG